MPNPPIKKPAPKKVIHKPIFKEPAIQARYTTAPWHPESTDPWKPSDTAPIVNMKPAVTAPIMPTAPVAPPIVSAGINRAAGGGANHASFADPGPAFTPAVADLSQNPYPGYYDKLLAYVKANADARPAEYASVGEQFKAQQNAANQGMYNSYMGSRAGTDASATALGVDPKIVSAARDLAMRQSQENSDQNLADNLAWLAKSGLLAQQQGQAYLTQFADQKATSSAGWDAAEQQRVADANLAAVQQLAAAASAKRGGGGKGGGGGGSSGKVSTTASDTSTLEFGGADKAFYDQLVASGNTAAAALFLNQMNVTQGTPGLKATQQRINDLTQASQINGRPVSRNNAYYTNPASAPRGPINPAYAAAQQAAYQLPLYNQILPGFMGMGGIMGSPKVVQKVANTAKGKS